jgi:hypothetical protein
LGYRLLIPRCADANPAERLRAAATPTMRRFHAMPMLRGIVSATKKQRRD